MHHSAKGLFSVLLSGLIAFTLVGCQPDTSELSDQPLTKVFLVRHAEKQLSEDSDPDLTPDGHARAQALAHVLGETGVDVVYATQYLRTQNTAYPLADLLGSSVSVVEATPSYAADMVQRIRSSHSGETVVVVSHSNTVPGIIAEFGIETIPVIEENEYDDLYLVIVGPSGEAELVSMRYGRETN